MPEPLSADTFARFEKHFDETMRTIADTLADHGSLHAAHTKRFDKIDERLDKMDERLKRIEDHLWNQQRFEEHERRIIELAKTSGRPDLATPFTKPIGA